MNVLQECIASVRLVFTGQTTCKLCFITAPVVWVFGSFLLGVNAITIYAQSETSAANVYLILFGLFMLLCGIFSASNTIHICIQQPTSHIAFKIQKYAQVVVLGLVLGFLIIGWAIRDPEGYSEGDRSLSAEYDELLWQHLIFLGLFLVTTLSCLNAQPFSN